MSGNSSIDNRSNDTISFAELLALDNPECISSPVEFIK